MGTGPDGLAGVGVALSRARPCQATGVIDEIEPIGDYLRLRLRVPAVARDALPGQFVAVAVGDEPSAMLLRRSFSLYRAEGDDVEVVISPHGPGTRWLANRRVGDALDLVGPLGRPFLAPEPDVGCVLVGGGYGSAPLIWLARTLAERGNPVHAVFGAATGSRLFGADQARRWCRSVTVTTEDGSQGMTGRVTDPLPDLLGPGRSEVFGCGPMGMLAAVHQVAADHGAGSQSAVEEAMACGIGVCMTCVLPVVDSDGTTRMTRSCTEGPVFDGYRVRWQDAGTVPADALGAPTAGGRR